jgi:type IV secretion system protein VirB2
MKLSLSVNRQLSFAVAAAFALLCAAMPELAFAGSPFATGATAAQTNILTILTPVAVIAVMVAGVMAWFGKISWWWLVGVIIGIVLVFGGPQIVAWIRGMFGV